MVLPWMVVYYGGCRDSLINFCWFALCFGPAPTDVNDVDLWDSMGWVCISMKTNGGSPGDPYDKMTQPPSTQTMLNT